MVRSLWHWLAYLLGLDPRGLFVFFDGRRWRYADPMGVARRLWSLPDFDSSKSRELIASGTGTLVVQGYAEIAEAVRLAFEVNPVESRGLTELECDQLLTQFEAYLGDLKKNGSRGPTSGPYTVPDVSLPIPGAEFHTKDASGSG